LIVATGVNQTIFGKKGKDKIKVKGGKNKIYGGKDDDDCEGGDDDDEIRGDRGKDKIHGGKGNDKIDGGKDDDIIFGGSGKDTCKGDDGDDWVHGNDGDDDVDGGAGSDTVYGGKGDDKCEGGEGNDTVRGDRGNDNVSGGDGNDNVNGGKDNDTVIGGAGSDVCMGDDGDDSVMGGDGDDSVMGGAGSDTVIGGAGSDVCMGDDGDDSVMGGAGDDTLMGGSGNDVCMGDDGDDSVMGGDGDDTLMGGAGKDTLVAGDGNDMVDGGDGDDSVVGGGSGNDTLMGGSGNDTIVGGTGNHTCTGGAGDDVFVIGDRNSGPNSVITDYTDNDKLLLSGSLSFSSLSFVQVGLNTEIRGSSSFVLALLLNVNASILKAGNFLGATGGTISTPTPTPTPVAAPRPINTPPRGEANNILIASSSGTQTTITSDLLRFVGGQQGASGTVFKLTELPDTKTGQLFFKGVAVTQIGFSFTQADINAGSLTFQAAAGFIGAATFGFDVNQGTNVIVGQRFSLKIEQNVFKFPGNTTPQVIVGSATLDNDIEGGDGDDDIKGGSGKDIIKGGKGKDKIKGGDGDNDIDGGDDDDDIEGGKGKNKIKGGLGNDKIKGGDDDDSIEGGAGTNTLTGGAGKDRFIYKTSRQEITTVAEADLITDFNVEDDVLEFSNAAFALSVTSLTRLSITATSAVGSIGSSNLLDFSADITVTSIATLQARFAALGGNIDTPTFCQFTDAATGRSVLVFAVGARFEIVASFSVKISLEVRNFVFTGPALNIPVGTVGPDNINFGTYPAAVNFDGLGGDDNIVGSNFNDSIKGGDGNDTITGGLGLDVLSGGSGADLFVYATTKEGGDKITDFTFGVDKFQFVASEFGNLTTTNFDGVSGSTPDITGKELVIFTGGTFASLEAAQAKALGNSTSPGFFVYTNASNETVLAFDSNGTIAGGSTIIASLGTAAGTLGTADFVFTGSIANSPTTPAPTGSIADLNAAGNTFPIAFNNFGSGAGGYNFSTPVLFTGNASANSVTGTEFADIITGGGGADILTGGSGADIFGYKAPADGADTITDFTFGVDKFQFAASEFGNLTTTNFDGVTGSTPDITGKELVIFTGGTYATVEAAQAKALGNSTTAGFFAYSNASNETVLVFDSNGTATGGSQIIANLGTAAGNLGTSDFVFTGTITSAPIATSPSSSGSVADLTAAGNTFPVAFNNFGSGAGGYNFSTPVLFTGNASANSVTGTEFADIITGGGGADILTGGSGADIFGYKAPADGADTITDFTFGVDKFQFAASEFGNLTTTNFDGVTGSTPDITGKELVIFTGGTYATVEAAQAKALGNSTTAGFFAYSNASNETVLVFDSNGTATGGSQIIANLGTAAGNLGTSDFVFTGTITSAPIATSPSSSGSVADLTAAGNTFPVAFNNFGSGAGGYNFSTPVLFTGNGGGNSVTGTQFADIINGGSGADIFDGGAGNDSLFGGGGSDTINGGAGNDTLIGGLGTNVLNGGAGADVFVFSGTAAGGGDLITSYSIVDDVINLDKTGFAAFTSGAGALGSSFYKYSSTVTVVTALEATLTGPSIMAIYDGLSTKLYYDSNGSTVGGSSLFATVDVNLGVSGNTELFLF
ncbi:calcium-binding protein, partial [filamentous cyanobacterium Phorm 46]